MSEIEKSTSEVDQELTLEAQQHLMNLEALVQFRELHPEMFETIAPKVKAILTEGDNPIIPVLSEEEIKGLRSHAEKYVKLAHTHVETLERIY